MILLWNQKHISPQNQAQTLSHPTSISHSTSSRKPRTEMQPGDVAANSKESEKELHPLNS